MINQSLLLRVKRESAIFSKPIYLMVYAAMIFQTGVTGGSIFGRIQKLLNHEVDIHIAEQEVVICNSGRATVLVCSLINRLLLLRRKPATCDGWHI